VAGTRLEEGIDPQIDDAKILQRGVIAMIRVVLEDVDPQNVGGEVIPRVTAEAGVAVLILIVMTANVTPAGGVGMKRTWLIQ